jgi:hypothetical protein
MLKIVAESPHCRSSSLNEKRDTRKKNHVGINQKILKIQFYRREKEFLAINFPISSSLLNIYCLSKVTLS